MSSRGLVIPPLAALAVALLSTASAGRSGDSTAVERLDGLGPVAVISALGSARPGSDEALSLAGALHGRSRTEVLEALSQSAAESETAAQRLGVLRATMCVGGATELTLAVRTAEAAPEGESTTARVHGALEQATAAILTREPGALLHLPPLVRDSSHSIAGALLRGAAEAGVPQTTETLARMLGENPGLDAAILTQLGRAGRNQLPPLAPEVSSELERFIDSSDERVARAGLQAAGQLEDFNSAAVCVELLDSPSEGLRESSRWALERMTGRRNTDAGWKAWLSSEQSWYAHRGAELRRALAEGDARAWVPALEQLGHHEYRRHELALLVARQLGDARDADTHDLLCQALTRIGSRAAIPALVERMEFADSLLAAQAHAALLAITGLEHELGADAWRAVAEGVPSFDAALGSLTCCGS